MTENAKLPHAPAPDLGANTWPARESWRVFGIMPALKKGTEAP